MDSGLFDLFFNQFSSKIYRKRCQIIPAGEISQNIYYIKSGYARAYSVSLDGQELTMIIFQPGDFFPLISTVEPKESRYYVESMTQLEVISVSRENFLEFFGRNPKLLSEIIIRLTARFEGALTRMEYLVFGTAKQKMASIILILGERFGDVMGSKILIKAPLTHKDLASLVGVTRETASIILKQFVISDLISKHNKNVIIMDIAGLKKESILYT